MKKRFFVLLLAMVVTGVGAAISYMLFNSRTVDNSDGDDVAIGEVIVDGITEDTEEDLRHTSIKESYNEILPKIQELYLKNNLKFTTDNNGSDFYDGVSNVSLYNFDLKDVGTLYNASYQLMFDNYERADSIFTTMAINSNAEYAKSSDFTLENTAIADLNKLLLGESGNIEELNKFVKSYYNGSGIAYKSYEFDNISTTISVSNYDIYYTVKMNLPKIGE